jgi:Predicted membrane protein (DUF2142)
VSISSPTTTERPPSGARGPRWRTRALLSRARAAAARLPRAARICALVALLNAVAWSLITPPFQGRDEVDHFAYVAQLAENHALPTTLSGPPLYAAQEALVLEGLHYWQVRFTPYTPAISSMAQQSALTEDLKSGETLAGDGEAGSASSEPPLYYVLQTVPYEIGAGDVLTQLQLMRLTSALMGALTALLIFLFLAEALPGAPWAVSVGALCVALAPAFAFVSGSLNPDALIFTLSAGVFLCMAIAFRRGLTVRLAVALGLLIAAGLATYFSFVGVAVGAVAGLVPLAIREVRRRGRGALLAPGIAATTALLPAVVYGMRNLYDGHAIFGLASSVGGALTLKSLPNEVSYIWQLYLPRLPGMPHYFAGITTWREIWFDRSVGLYGWMDTTFPTWVDNVALAIAAAIALLCARELVRRRGRLISRLTELAVYLAIALGVLVMIGVASYRSDVIQHEFAYGEPRYLLPLLPLLGVAIALAVRGAGQRWAPVAGAALIILFLGHDVFSQLQVIARFYG